MRTILLRRRILLGMVLGVCLRVFSIVFGVLGLLAMRLRVSCIGVSGGRIWAWLLVGLVVRVFLRSVLRIGGRLRLGTRFLVLGLLVLRLLGRLFCPSRLGCRRVVGLLFPLWSVGSPRLLSCLFLWVVAC